MCAASRSLHALLVGLGHDVVSARDGFSHATDEALLAMAAQEQHVLITEDKDFGELIFVRRLPHPCVVRFVVMRITEKMAAMRDLIAHHADAMQNGTIIVVTRERVRLDPEQTNTKVTSNGTLAQNRYASPRSTRRPLVQC